MGNANHTASPELLPCPFCSAHLVYGVRSKCWGHPDDAEGCIASQVYIFDDDDAAFWNTRARQPQSPSTSPVSDAMKLLREARAELYKAGRGYSPLTDRIDVFMKAKEEASPEHGPHCSDYHQACRQCLDRFAEWKRGEASPAEYLAEMEARPCNQAYLRGTGRLSSDQSPADEVERMRSAILAAGVPMLTFSDADTLARAALSAIKGQQSTVDEVEPSELVRKWQEENHEWFKRDIAEIVEGFAKWMLNRSAIRNGDEGVGK